MNSNLVSFREALGIDRKDMAISIGVKYSHYRMIESGERNPSFQVLNNFIQKYPNSDVKKIFFKSQ